MKGMKKFAVFDIDGTLYRGNFYVEVIDQLFKKDVFDSSFRDQANIFRRAWQQREHNEAYRKFVDYMVDIWAKYSNNVPIAEFEEICQTVVQQNKNRTYRYTRDLIKQLKEDGYFVIAISGSFQEVVEPFAKIQGFDLAIGELNTRSKTHLSGEVERVTYINKDKIVSKLIKKHKLTLEDSIAVGDTRGDIEMLEMAENPIAFNPETQLFDYAKKQGWKIVVERKNIIYKLENQDGKYILA